MSYKYDPYKDSFTHVDNEELITANITIPCSEKAVIVKQYEITDECIERIADAVVRKLKEVGE